MIIEKTDGDYNKIATPAESFFEVAFVCGHH